MKQGLYSYSATNRECESRIFSTITLGCYSLQITYTVKPITTGRSPYMTGVIKMRWMVFVSLMGLVGLGVAHGQALNDPAIDGMQVLPRVEGCNIPGGLQPITSSDGPNDAMFWCGLPPYCLTMPVGSPERCHIIPGSRNGGQMPYGIRKTCGVM